MTRSSTQPTASDMLRSKVVHNVARPSAPKSINCPIDKLPAEIIHMICVHLRPTELANLRLASRLVGPISLRYMVPEIHLILAKDSFEQLKAIAAHPIASKHITSFFFEADRFRDWSRGRWEQSLVGPEYVEHLVFCGTCSYPESMPGHGFASKCPSNTPFHHYIEEEMARAYENYVELLRFQQMHPDETEMAEAMKHFPRLNEIKMTISDCGQGRTWRLKKVFQPALIDDYETDAAPEMREEPLGLQQMQSLLLGAYSAGLKVEILQCGLFDWRIFDQPDKTFSQMKASVSNVKNLRLDFDTGGDIDDGNQWWIPSDPQDLTRRLADFLTAASKLEHLQISFQRDRATSPGSLKDIVGEHRWPSLKSVNLKMIGTTDDELVSFCSRHASTLKSVHLTDVGFFEGAWFDALNRMRKILALDALVLGGLLESPAQNLFCQEYPDGSAPHHKRHKSVLEEWFLRACPGAEKELDDFIEMVDVHGHLHKARIVMNDDFQ